MKSKIRLSLRLKLMSLLVLLTSVMLAAYGWLALSDFSKDKIAYVYSSLLSHSRNTSSQVRSELDFVANKIKFYLRGYSFEEGKFHQYTHYNLKSDPRVDALWAYSVIDYISKKPIDSVFKGEIPVNEREEIQALASSLVSEAMVSSLSLRLLKSNLSKWLMGLHFKDSGGSGEVVVLALVNKSYFVDNIVSSNMEDTFLVDGENRVVVAPFEPHHLENVSDLEKPLKDLVTKSGGKSGIFELAGADGEEWLVSLVDIGLGGLKVVAVVSRDFAMSAIRVLEVKSLFFLLILICFTVILSVLGSRKLTGALKALLESTRKVASGDFNVESKVKSGDEIGELAEGFNLMTVEIRRLLRETAEKARMQSELETAQTVQSTLFPPLKYIDETIEIHGFYQPASECGGDWFYYMKQGLKTYMLIGDATGHGVPAALVTAAAKSASRVIEEFPDVELSKIVGVLNRAIYETSRGKVMMTFFVGCFDSLTSEFTYVNASHDPPFLVPYIAEKLKKKHLAPLMGKSCKRLGEGMDSVYEEETLKLSSGDRIVFYTDGVTELMNHEHQMWGERKFIRTLLESFNSRESIEQAMEDLALNISEHRKGFPLDDDLTYFMFQKRLENRAVEV